MLTQVELERMAYGYGRARAAERIEQREKQGQGSDNPYGQALYRRFVLPLAALITEEQTKVRGRGRKPAHLKFLAPLHPENTALVVVRAAVVHLVSPKYDNARILFTEMGQAAYHEHLLEHFSHVAPDLFNSLAKGFASRMSKDERYRLNLVRDAAAEAGQVLPEWEQADIERLGMWMADSLATLGLLTITTRRKGPTESVMESSLTEACMKIVDESKSMVIENSPYFTPCVAPPMDWVAYNDGGYHTPEMRRLMPFAVKSSALGREALAAADLRESLAALNAMQRTAWRINQRIMDTLLTMGGKVDLGEVLAQGEEPRPVKPEWMQERVEIADMTEAQLKEFRQWKREATKWHTKTRERVVKWGRYRQAMDVAKRFRDYPAIYFVYFCDFRDRKYAQTSGVSPQGSDLQKALLEAAEGQSVPDQESLDWFMITGANRFGYDKVDLPSRVQWCEEHREAIIACAEDPTGNQWWLKADKPLQFLAWAFEYAELAKVGQDAFLSRVSVGMDGSCNGLQNFSAMLRDEVGGLATNLIASPTPQDIYGSVAVRTTDRLIADTDAPQDEEKLAKWLATRGLRQKWLDHGVGRKVCKRPVMTLPYGSTRFSCTDFIVGDYLAEGLAPEFEEDDYFAAARYLGGHVWDAIGDVVVKAREAMVWLQTAAGAIIDGGDKVISWTTPVGFPVVQAYWQETAYRINTKLCGRQLVKIYTQTSDPEKRRHKNGVSPNFIHSMDAAHLTRVAVRLEAEGVQWMHMVHDDFGVRPGDAGRLSRIIREEFIRLYEESDPLADFQRRYPSYCPPMPERGTLDLQCVKSSPFFFS